MTMKSEQFQLTSPTPEEVRRAVVSDAKPRKGATANVDTPAQFVLTGSNRAADQAGQASLF